MRRKNSSVQEWETKKLNKFDHSTTGNGKPCRTQSTISSSKRSIPGELNATDAPTTTTAAAGSGSHRTFDEWETSGAETAHSMPRNSKVRTHSAVSSESAIERNLGDSCKAAQFYS